MKVPVSSHQLGTHALESLSVVLTPSPSSGPTGQSAVSQNEFGIFWGFVFLFLVNPCTLRLQAWIKAAT